MRTVKKFSIAFAKWVFIACAVGVIGGIVGSLFHMAVNFATGFRDGHSWTLYLMPLAGLFIIFSYRVCKVNEETGTNLIISSVRGNIKVPLLMAPLIFLGTVLTHLTGGSAGREGAALQLGGSIGAKAGELLKLDEKDSSLVIMCGMSAVFAALFGTPLTATFFAMEVISVGVIYYVGLVPCIASSLIAYKISLLAGLAPTKFNITGIPRLSLVSVTQIAALAALCAVISILLCMVMEFSHSRFQMYLPNTYLRIAVGGVVIIALTLLVGTRDYNGAGVDVIVAALEKGKACFCTHHHNSTRSAALTGASFFAAGCTFSLFSCMAFKTDGLRSEDSCKRSRLPIAFSIFRFAALMQARLTLYGAAIALDSLPGALGSCTGSFPIRVRPIFFKCLPAW